MYKAIICRIKTSPISGADKIQIADCAGYTAIVGKEHKAGELGIFFPSDGQLSREMVKYNKLHRDDGGYLENNRRIKTIKLMKVKSEGIWLPLNSLNWTNKSVERRKNKNKDFLNIEKRIDQLQEGDKLTYFNFHHLCNKYVTKATKEKSKKSKSLFDRIKNKWNSIFSKKSDKLFPKHFDTENIRHILNDRNNPIPIGIKCDVTIKAHGTSARSGKVKKETFLTKWFGIKPKYEYLLGTRNLILPNPKCDDIYRFIAHEIIKLKLRNDEIIYYEIVGFGENGKSIMPPHKISDAKIAQKFADPMYYSYGMKSTTTDCSNPKYGENFDIYVYRITYKGINLSPDELEMRCLELELKSVPFVMTLNWDGNVEKFLAKCKMLSELNSGRSRIDSSHIEEGICLRFYQPEGCDDNCELFDLTAKYKSWLFCDCEGIAKNSDSYIDPEEIEE